MRINTLGRRPVAALAFAVGMAMVALVAAPAGAAAAPDLQSIVLSAIPGYELAPPGTGLSGPLTKDQLSDFALDPASVKAVTGMGVPSYARTFVSTESRVALIVAFDAESVGGAKAMERGARTGAESIGPVTPVPGITGAFRVEAPPEKASGAFGEQVFFRKAQLAFWVTVVEATKSPALQADVLRVSEAQAAAVPLTTILAAEQDPAEVLGDAGRLLGYGIATVLQLGIIVLLVVVLISRRRPPAAVFPPPPSPLAPWAPPPPQGAPAPWAPAPPAPAPWPAPQPVGAWSAP